MTTGDADHVPALDTTALDEFAAMTEKVAAAPHAADIQNLADRAIGEIRALADQAVAKATQVEELMTQLKELLERADEEP